MRCRSCGKTNLEERRFCAECGAALPLACRSCGFINQAGVRYCGSCGVSLGENANLQDKPRAPESFVGGRYRAIRLLGEGGSKTVYLAHDESLDRDVAFALVRIGGLDPAGRERVAREARAMGRLGDHPHVVHVYDVGEDQGQPYIVSQYMAGGSVDDLIAHCEGRRLEIADALSIASDVCKGLEHAHSLGVVHRDVKPGNVWLTKDARCKLGDFGLAVARDLMRVTASGVMVGTVAYMAPEQVEGKPPEPRSDLYSTGAMLYEMITGHPPFQGADLLSVITQHLNSTPELPSAQRPEIPRTLDALVMELLAKRPDDRPASAAAVDVRLRAIIEGLSNAMEKVAKSVAVERPNLSIHAASDGTVSILFSDIENSTALYDRLGNHRAQEIVRAHNSIVRAQIAAHRGREVKAMGDGFMVVFGSARRALQCAVAVQRAFAAYSRENPRFPISVRVGLHVGEAIRESGDFFGSAVIMAARIGSKAEGGEILVSSVFKEVIAGADEVPFDEGRQLPLKGFAGTIRVHRVLWDNAHTASAKTCATCGNEIAAGSTGCASCTKPGKRAPTLPMPQFEFGRPDELIVLSKGLIRSTPPRRIAIAGATLMIIAATSFAVVQHQRSMRAESASPRNASIDSKQIDHPREEQAPSAPSPPEATHREARRKKGIFVSRTNPASAAAPRVNTSTDNTAAEGSSPRGKYNIVVNDAMGRDDADEIADRLRGLGYNAYLLPTEKNGETSWMIKVGPYQTAAEASAAQQQLNQKYRDAYPPSQ